MALRAGQATGQRAAELVMNSAIDRAVAAMAVEPLAGRTDAAVVLCIVRKVRWPV